MRKRALSIGLALISGISFLGACTNNENTESSTSTSLEDTDESTVETTLEETTEETTVEDTEETTEETTQATTEDSTEETTVDSVTNGDWELDEDGNIVLPEFESLEPNTIRNEYAVGAESEEAALVSIDDCIIESYEEGAVVRNNSEYAVTYSYFDIAFGDSESTPLALYQSTILPGEVFPTLVTVPEDLILPEGDNEDAKAVEPQITGMYIVISTDFGYQEILYNFNESDEIAVIDYEDDAIQNIEQVWVTEDELDISISADGDQITATLVNNSEYPIAEFTLFLDAPDLVFPNRYSDLYFNFSKIEDPSLDTPVLPGESISRTINVQELLISVGEDIGYLSDLFIDIDPYLEDIDIESWEITRFLLNLGVETEESRFSNLNQYDAKLDSYYQSQYVYEGSE